MNIATRCLFGGALLGAGLASNANAGEIPAFTINDALEITDLGSSSDYGDYTYSYGSMSIDTWNFTVLSDSWVALDILSYEFFETGFDSSLWLFHNDGQEFSYGGNYIDWNDDYDLDDDYNGSVDEYDSFIERFLKAGEYTVAVAYYSVNIDEVNDGNSQSGTIYGPSGDGDPLSGQYQLDFYGDIALVPAPTTLALLSLAGLTATRPRR